GREDCRGGAFRQFFAASDGGAGGSDQHVQAYGRTYGQRRRGSGVCLPLER
ncbi:unnamed protein product, partial [Ascophyllum nodosum]